MPPYIDTRDLTTLAEAMNGSHVTAQQIERVSKATEKRKISVVSVVSEYSTDTAVVTCSYNTQHTQQQQSQSHELWY